MPHSIHGSPPAAVEPEFCELIKECRLCELTVRIAKAVIHFFVTIVVGIYEAFAWVCETIYNCITCQCCSADDSDGPVDIIPPHPDSPKLPRPAPITLPLPTPKPKPVERETKTYVERLNAIIYGVETTEDLKAFVPLLDASSEEGRLYTAALKWREAHDAALKLRRAPGRIIPDLPTDISVSTTFESPKRVVLQDGPASLETGEKNRKEALTRITELKAAVETTLAGLQAGDQQEALQRLAEFETGTPAGTLKSAPAGVLDQLKAMPVRIKNLFSGKLEINKERAALWPEGVRAADRLADYEKRPKEELLRLAQIETMKRLYDVHPEMVVFNLDLILEPYKKGVLNPTASLKEWYGFAYAGELEPPSQEKCQEKYDAALDRYKDGKDHGRGTDPVETSQSLLAAEYMSYIHDILTKKREKLVKAKDMAVGEKAVKEIDLKVKAFREVVRTFVRQIGDANKDCIDQMNSQLENQILSLIVDESSGSRQEKMQFKVGLALCQYRASLIGEYIQEIYPDEKHMADLERYAKDHLSGLLNLSGKIFNSKAQFSHCLENPEAKTEKIGQAVQNKYTNSYLDWLTKQCQADENTFPVTKSLRDDIRAWSNDHFLLLELDDEHPFVQELSKVKDDPMKIANEGGPLTFEAILVCLETTGILVTK